MFKDFSTKNFKGLTMDQMRFYYFNYVDVDSFPTFIHWVLEMRKQGKY